MNSHLGDMPPLSGLTQAEAVARLRSDGDNRLPSARRRGFGSLLRELLREPMILLLVGIALTYFLIGDPKQAVLLLASVVVIMAIQLYQQGRSEHALERLRDYSSPRALVVRDGAQQRIAGHEVVRGDILIISEGDRVPADGVVLWAINLHSDESLLTGESLPVRKIAARGEEAPQRPGGDDLPFVYSGSLIVSGKGVARVTATGVFTEIGKIGRALQSIEPESGALQRETGRVVRVFGALGLAVCVLVALATGIGRGDWLSGALNGLTLAISMTPEEFPVVLTIFLVMGAWRMSRRQVLARRIPAIEALGTTTVLCVDKTGTITENRMSVARLWADGMTYVAGSASAAADLPEEFHALVEFTVLASQGDPSDPMERAFAAFANDRLAHTEHLHTDWTLVREYPLSPELLALSHVWTSADAQRYVVAAKGAPEAMVDLCHLPEPQGVEIAAQVARMAADGLRVLGVARASFDHTTLPSQQHAFDFEMLGLIAVADPIRASVPAAIAECYAAGIEVVMITGDHPGTARHIAAAAGLRPREPVLTGFELEQISEEQLSTRISGVNVFARMAPEHKLRLVQALQKQGEIVTMTGDGVNDAPALKAAHIGVAMGQRGTDVAREAAALVLVNDDFGSLVTAVRMGRRIYDNLKKAMGFVIAVHIPIAGVALVPVLLGWPLVLMPVHIVFLELIIDPACSIAFEAEPEEADLMRRRPRRPDELLFDRRLITLAVVQGASVLLASLTVFALGRRAELADTLVRALSFATLICGMLGLIFVNRSWTHGGVATLQGRNVALWTVAMGTSLMLLAVLYIPWLADLFRFAPPSPGALALVVLAGFLSVLWTRPIASRHGRAVVRQGTPAGDGRGFPSA